MPAVAKDANGWVEVRSSGWFWAHEAIRADMIDTLAILKRLSAAPSIAPWEAAALLEWWNLTAEFIEHHHDNEEHLFFPKIAERVELPARLNTDHKTLLEMLTKTGDAVKAALAAVGAPPGEAAAAGDGSQGGQCLPLADKPNGFAVALELMQAMHDHMQPHLREEETDTLPAMMKAFKFKEFQKIEEGMIKAMPWWALPHLLRRLKGDRAAAKAATAALGVPAIIFSLVIRPQLDRYDAEYGWAPVELLAPQSHDFFEEQRARSKLRAGFCGCLAPRPKPQSAAPA